MVATWRVLKVSSLKTSSSLDQCPQTLTLPSANAAIQTTTDGPVSEEPDVLTALETATILKMEEARKKGPTARRENLEADEGELKISKRQLSSQLERMDSVLELTRSYMRFVVGEYKTARSDFLAGERIVESVRTANRELSRAKNEAEHRCRVQEYDIKKAYETIEDLKRELAVEKARVVELETKYGV